MWRVLVGLVLLLAWVAPSAAATYFVATNGSDSNPCTQAQPCATINKGRSLLGSGDTLYLRGGTYNQSITVNTNTNLPSGNSWSSATIIAGYPGEAVTLTSGEIYPGIQLHFHTGGTQGVVRYVIFQNFKITGNGGLVALGCGYPVDMNCGPHFIRWQDIEISGTSASSIGNGNGASDLEYIRIKAYNCGSNRLDHCFYVSSPRMLIDDVETFDSAGYGIQVDDSGCPMPHPRHCSDDVIIRNSRIHHNHGDGGVTMSQGSNMQFYNNLVYNNDNGGLAGVCYGSPNNTQIYNNTFYGNGGDAISICDGVTNSVIKNNIMFSNNFPIQDLGAGTVRSNNLESDPHFVNAGAADFTIQGDSAARNTGVTLTTFNTDRVGAPRGQGGAWDIGAYEYAEGGGPTFDFSVATPSAQTVQRGTAITVPVTANLTAGTGAPVSWSIAGLPSGVSGSFTGSPCTPSPSCSSTLTLTATGGASLGTFTTPLLTGTGGGLTRQANFTLTVSAPTAVFDFSLGNPGPQTVARSAATQVPLNVTLLTGTAGPVTLSVTAGLPAGVSASFTNNPCTPPCISTLTLSASLAATVGTQPLTIHGVGGGQAHDLTVDLTVTNVTSSANPIYVRKAVGSPTNSCLAAENPATAKQSIGDACQCMTVPGKVMYIEGSGNTYVEMVDTGSGCPLTGGNGPSYDTATRLEGYGTPVPTIQAPVGADMALFLRNSGDHYLIFKKLVFDAANQAPNTIAVFPVAHHIRFEEVDARNTGGGFETFFLTGASNIELVDTFLHDAGADALTLDASISNFLCQRCHLFNAAGKGLNVTSVGTKTNLTFQETEVRNNTGVGVDIGASTGTLLQNMPIHSNGSNGVWIRLGTSGMRAYNNTIYGNAGVGLQCDSGATSTELRNNIIYGNGTPPGTANLVNNCGATVAANLQTDPLFVGPPGNLHLADGSPAIDAGELIPSILTDYDGQPRQQGTQDIGAYERIKPSPVGPGVTEEPCNLLAASMYF